MDLARRCEEREHPYQEFGRKAADEVEEAIIQSAEEAARLFAEKLASEPRTKGDSRSTQEHLKFLVAEDRTRAVAKDAIQQGVERALEEARSGSLEFFYDIQKETLKEAKERECQLTEKAHQALEEEFTRVVGRIEGSGAVFAVFMLAPLQT